MMIAGDILGQFVFNVSPAHKIPKENLGVVIRIENGQVIMDLNKDYAYRIMAQRDLIVAGLNKKLDELIQKHLESKAQEEQGLEDLK